MGSSVFPLSQMSAGIWREKGHCYHTKAWIIAQQRPRGFTQILCFLRQYLCKMYACSSTSWGLLCCVTEKQASNFITNYSIKPKLVNLQVFCNILLNLNVHYVSYFIQKTQYGLKQEVRNLIWSKFLRPTKEEIHLKAGPSLSGEQQQLHHKNNRQSQYEGTRPAFIFSFSESTPATLWLCFVGLPFLVLYTVQFLCWHFALDVSRSTQQWQQHYPDDVVLQSLQLCIISGKSF